MLYLKALVPSDALGRKFHAVTWERRKKKEEKEERKRRERREREREGEPECLPNVTQFRQNHDASLW